MPSLVKTTVAQYFLHHHCAGRVGIALDTKPSGCHLVTNLDCKVDAPTAPNQTVWSGLVWNDKYVVEHCYEAKQIHD